MNKTPSKFFGRNIEQKMVFLILYFIFTLLTLFLFQDIMLLDKVDSGNILFYTIYLIFDVIILFFMMRILDET